ncbi:MULTISPECIES: nucleotide exchange factor GrpE [Pontibacillus]|uniref:Nucleotide exchange factor GrpE n=1 Tax=Pontibacillus chungwhensis TaxID=265426 RepID=A0ABY8UVT1_9BACI|nr:MULTISPECIES: nucleotide exchange factor GrpE [Pontibacillus]MCD5324154.1 nucleotide exchange factor GrpE [Pontibacillus sp. HN14]WIF97787.1 nucleotide exchange factor GrpE [Pontibacillus chungwhensis]
MKKIELLVDFGNEQKKAKGSRNPYSFFVGYTKRLFNWNLVLAYESFNRNMSDLLESLKVEVGNEVYYPQWNNQMEKLQKSMEDGFEDLIQRSGDEENMEEYKQIIEEEILNLEPLDSLDTTSDGLVEQTEIATYIQEIKGEVKKGNRVSMKLIQELQDSILDLAKQSSKEDQTFVENEQIQWKEKTEGFINLVIEGYDAIDLIYRSAENSGLTQWQQHIEGARGKYLNQMNELGVEEITVLGLLIDGEKMISLGTVPPDQYPEVDKYHVAEVLQAGFIYKETGDVLREAKVKTVYY